MLYHSIAFIAGFFIDMLLGDPQWLFHPIRLIGALISFLEKKLLNDKQMQAGKERACGTIMVLLVLFVTVAITAGLLWLFYWINPILGCIAESIMTYQILATRCLKVESMKVYSALKTNDIAHARKAVSMIVGRDTKQLDETGVTKAVVETVAENTSDGVIAPMLFLALGGPILGFFYKAVNTMDSMVGYKKERYINFGRTAARLDDVVNFIPARISAFLMIAACAILGKEYSAKEAYRIFKRDRFKHASPNSAQTESVCAGGLGIRLAGDACYFGKVVKKPYIGDESRSVEIEDIRRACKLLYGTAFLCEALCVGVMLAVLIL